MASTPTSEHPTLVIGAGVVGLACAVELARAGRWVVLLEQERRYGTGTSSRNSGVIHAGLYYPPGSLKARLCVEGRERLYAYAREKDVPHRRCGKLVVATEPSELPELEALAARARRNGVADVELLDAAEVRRRAPSVAAVAALWSPSTGIVDPHRLMDALAADARAAGVDLVLGRALVAARPMEDGWRVRLRATDGALEEVEVDGVVNAAGLFADEIARLATPELPPELSLEWSKGNYFSIRPAAHAPVDFLVYPCPNPGLKGLGIHLTLDLDGAQRLGPDFEALPGRLPDYSVDPARRASFLAAARRYLPHLAPGDLEPAFAGLRPRLRGEGFHDFHIAPVASARSWVNLVGIDSPGLTAALAIGAHVAQLMTTP